MFTVAVLLLAYVPMIAETLLSASHERRLRAAGAIEPRDDVYRFMQVAYPACFVAMVGESWLRERGLSATALAGLGIFAAAKALKYWAMATLGDRWTFRVLVPPGSSRTIRGPYRVLRHPNYIAVAAELAGFAVLAQAPIAGTAALLVFVPIMLARIRVEERALGLRSG